MSNSAKARSVVQEMFFGVERELDDGVGLISLASPYFGHGETRSKQDNLLHAHRQVMPI